MYIELKKKVVKKQIVIQKSRKKGKIHGIFLKKEYD